MIARVLVLALATCSSCMRDGYTEEDGCTVDADCEVDVENPRCDPETNLCVNPCGECSEGELCDLATETCA